MNDILQLKGSLQHRPSAGKPGHRNGPTNASSITTKKLGYLLSELQELELYWDRQSIIEGCLIDVCYIDIIAKSNRVSGFFSKVSGSVNNSVVGARFAAGEVKKHVITHYIMKEILKKKIENFYRCSRKQDAAAVAGSRGKDPGI